METSPYTRDCPRCGTSFTAVSERGVCPSCKLFFDEIATVHWSESYRRLIRHQNSIGRLNLLTIFALQHLRRFTLVAAQSLCRIDMITIPVLHLCTTNSSRCLTKSRIQSNPICLIPLYTGAMLIRCLLATTTQPPAILLHGIMVASTTNWFAICHLMVVPLTRSLNAKAEWHKIG